MSVDEAWDPEHVPDIADALNACLIHPQGNFEKVKLWVEVFNQNCDFTEYVRRYKQHCTILGDGKNGWMNADTDEDDGDGYGDFGDCGNETERSEKECMKPASK